MKAVILAAGKGLRMRPLTERLPKTMLELHGKPILQYIIEGLRIANFNEITLIVGYKNEIIRKYFRNGDNFGVRINYILQPDQKGTGHATLLAEQFCGDEQFLLTYSDVLISYSIYQELYKSYKEQNERFVLVANPTNDPYRGAAIYYENDYVTEIIEKPPKGTSKSKLNNSGIFILSPEIFQILRNTPESIRGEVELTEAIKLGILHQNLKFRLIIVKEHQIRKDLGDIKDYEELMNTTKWLEKLKQ